MKEMIIIYIVLSTDSKKRDSHNRVRSKKWQADVPSKMEQLMPLPLWNSRNNYYENSYYGSHSDCDAWGTVEGDCNHSDVQEVG